jgi:hypothetical protein
VQPISRDVSAWPWGCCAGRSSPESLLALPLRAVHLSATMMMMSEAATMAAEDQQMQEPVPYTLEGQIAAAAAAAAAGNAQHQTLFASQATGGMPPLWQAPGVLPTPLASAQVRVHTTAEPAPPERAHSNLPCPSDAPPCPSDAPHPVPLMPYPAPLTAHHRAQAQQQQPMAVATGSVRVCQVILYNLWV